MVTRSCFVFPYRSIFSVLCFTTTSPLRLTCAVGSRVSKINVIFRMVSVIFTDTSVLLLCYYAVILILKYCSLVQGSAANWHLQHLERRCVRLLGFVQLESHAFQYCGCVLLKFYTSYVSLFPQDMIQDMYVLHWNGIRKSTGVAGNVSPYKLIYLSGCPNLNLT